MVLLALEPFVGAHRGVDVLRVRRGTARDLPAPTGRYLSRLHQP